LNWLCAGDNVIWSTDPVREAINAIGQLTLCGLHSAGL